VTQQPKLADRVTSQIRDWILTGTYRPGDKLPPERRLASLLGVNRGSLRLALKKLEQLGLLQARQGDGTRVRDVSRTAGIEVLPFLFQTALDRQPQVLRDVLEIRTLVCGYLVRLAARRATADDLQRLNGLLAQMESVQDDAEALLRLDFDMYWEYARVGHSLVGQLLLNTVRGPFERHSAPFVCMAADPTVVLEATRDVYRAVKEHDAERAGERVEQYLRQGARLALREAGFTSD
jgi:DNA-binding FadR family transcriptional regulator